MKATVYSETRLQQAIGELRRDFKESGYLRMSWSDEKPRTENQNRLIYMAYGRISAEGGEQSVAEVRRECKLLLGVPIMRAEDEEFRQAYDAVIKKLSYEQKLTAMNFWPVSSLMNTGQISRYYAAIQKQYQYLGWEAAA